MSEIGARLVARKLDLAAGIGAENSAPAPSRDNTAS